MGGVEELQVEEDAPIKDKSGKRNQLFASLAVNLLQVGVGCALGWLSPTIPKLMAADSHVPITLEQGSKMGYWLMAGTLLGPLLVWAVMDRIGRRYSLLLGAIVFLVSWLMLGLAPSVEVIYVARFISGMAVMVVVTVAPVYTAEISEPELRGPLGSTIQLLTNVGYLITYSVGPWVSYHVLLAVSASSVIPFLVALPWLRESPYFLMSKGKQLEAKQSLLWFRGRKVQDVVEKELIIIESSVAEVAKSSWPSQINQVLTESHHRKALFLSCGLFFFLQCSGMMVMTSFVQPILIQSGASLDPSGSSIVIGIVKVVSGASLPFFTSRFGIRVLLLATSCGLTVCLTLLTVYFSLQAEGVSTSLIFWIPVISIMFYMVFVSIGLAPLSFVTMGELFGPEVKAAGTTLATIFNSLAAVCVLVYHSHLTSQPHIVFGTFALISALALPYVFYLIPNTQHMTLQDIQSWLKGYSVPPEQKMSEAQP